MFCGSGGVGKTSTAAAAALTAAARLGGKVLVLTIDPAKRLADALGLEAFGNVARRVPLDAYAELGVEPRGELWAAMLDTKRSWDELVLRHAPDEATAYRILDNRMYHNVTSRFVQSHDYIAMERLYEVHASGEYDLIVIDTPPTRNAIDFLEAPARMADFFGGRLLRWLTMPYRSAAGVAAACSTPRASPSTRWPIACSAASSCRTSPSSSSTSSRCTRGSWSAPNAVEQLLHDRRTTFAVVTTLEGAPLREAETFCRELTARNFDLGALVLNKVLPEYLLSPDGEHAADAFSRESERDRARARRRRAWPGSTTPTSTARGAAHVGRLVPQLRGGRPARGGAAHRARAARASGSRGHRQRAAFPADIDDAARWSASAKRSSPPVPAGTIAP